MEKTAIHTDLAPRAIGPYSQAVRANGLVFTSGQLGMGPDGVLAEGVKEQAERALENLRSILAAAGSGMDRVIKTTVFFADMGDFAAVNEVYARFFPRPHPARSAVQVAALPRGGLVEIEAIAMAGENGNR